MKKTVALGVCIFSLFSHAVHASEYGLCINRSDGDWRKQVTCEQNETRRLMREVNNLYAHLASDPHFNKLNSGKTLLNEQFKQWQMYRNSYCAYWEAAKSGYGDEAYYKAECLKLMTQTHYNDLEKLFDAAYAVRE